MLIISKRLIFQLIYKFKSQIWECLAFRKTTLDYLSENAFTNIMMNQKIKKNVYIFMIINNDLSVSFSFAYSFKNGSKNILNWLGLWFFIILLSLLLFVESYLSILNCR